MDEEKRRVTVEFPIEIFEQIMEHKEEQYYPTMSATIIRLVVEGLESTKGRD